MKRPPLVPSPVVVFAVAFGALVAAQVQAPPTPPTPPALPQGAPPRDVVPPQQREPVVRKIPVGTAIVSGTVTSAATGRPIRGARVSVSGSTDEPPGGRGRGIAAGSARGTGPATSTSTTFVTGRSGEPIAVTTSLQGSGGFSFGRTTLTDALGQYSFPKLPAGQFSLSVSGSRYVSANYGEKRPGGPGTQIRVTDGQQMTANIGLVKMGVITGTVFAEDGEPQPSVEVRVWRFSLTNGVRRPQMQNSMTTDDRGTYRLSNLQPGEYIVGAIARQAMDDRSMTEMLAVERAIASGKVEPPTAPGLPPTVSVTTTPPAPGPMEQPPGLLPTFYPNTMFAANATVIRIQGDDEKIGIDLQTQLVRASTIQGAIAAALEPGMAVQLSLIAEDPMLAGLIQQSSTRADANGRFTFRNVPPGKYTVMAQTVVGQQSVTVVNGQVTSPPQPPPRLTDAQRLWGKVVVEVENSSAAQVSISLQAGRSISGVVIFDMERPPDLTRQRLTVNLSPAPSATGMSMPSPPPSVQLGVDGRFTLSGVMPGRYILRAGGIIKSAMVGGEDTLDFPLDFTAERDVTDAVLTMTDKSSELSGVLTDTLGKPAPDYTIVAAAADQKFWIPGSRRIAITRPATDGRFLIRNLPPGDYLLAAVTDVEQGGQYAPEFLKSLAGASVTVHVMEGGKVTQDIRIAR